MNTNEIGTWGFILRHMWGNGGRPLLVAAIVFVSAVVFVNTVIIYEIFQSKQTDDPWLTYQSPAKVLKSPVTQVDGLKFELSICNNSGRELENSGSFIWVQHDVQPSVVVTQQALVNRLKPGCVTRVIGVPLLIGVTAGRWHYEGHVCPIENPKQCADFFTVPFEVTP